MKNATLVAATFLLAAALLPSGAHAGLPEGKVAVVRAQAVEGLAKVDGPRFQSRESVYSFDGTEYAIDRAALTSLDGVELLVLVDRRKDSTNGRGLVENYTQEVIAVEGTSFEVSDLPGKVLAYQVAMIGGNLRLTGDGDHIMAKSGNKGPYQIWKIESIDLVNRDAVILR